jgi:hypothetical protein
MRADCTVELGYFNVPKLLGKTGFDRAEWNVAVLEEADERARQVIRDIREEVFDPAPGPTPNYFEEFAAICMDNVFSAPALADDDEGGSA